jgi:hypothetical protein
MKPRVSFGAVAAFAVLLTVVYILATKDRSEVQLRRIGKPLADSLDAYTRAHQACPPTLAAIGLVAPTTPYGPFTYRTWDGGTHCEISVGVYVRDGFQEYWLYPPGDWYSNR